MRISKYLWGKIFQLGILISLSTLDITIYGTTKYIEGIIQIVPWIRSAFILGILLALTGLRGLAKTCKNHRKFKLVIGRSLYLPTLLAVLITVIIQGFTINLLKNTQFVSSLLLFLFGYITSWTA